MPLVLSVERTDQPDLVRTTIRDRQRPPGWLTGLWQSLSILFALLAGFVARSLSDIARYVKIREM
jgi:hypothetical protein